MKEQSIIEVRASRPGWETLEAYAREGIRRLLQQMLEEEVEGALGRGDMSGERGWTRRRAIGTGGASRAG